MKYLFLLIILAAAYNIKAQTTENEDSLKNYALKIYIDCPYCDKNYIKEEIQFVNYVREQKAADVFILITYQSTGSGGTEYTLTFLGQNNFKENNDTLIYISKSDATSDEERIGIVQTLKMGLMPYVAKTPLGKLISISYESSDNENEEIEDKWRNWVTNINTECYSNGQEATNQTYFSSSLSVDKVTEKIKLETSAFFNYNESNYQIDDTTTYKSITKSQSFYCLGVMSISDHWSVGFTSNTHSSTYSNMDFSIYFAPAIEYNLFKYSESTRKQLRFLYKIGNEYNDYVDTTIYDKLKENLIFQKLSIAFSIKEKWGSISTSLSGSHYFHDIELNNVDLWANLRIRIIKGLSFNLYSYVSLIHDQLSLPKTGATTEEILLQRRMLATQYSYYFSAGLTYTFGSLYNNIVNPRFGN